MVGFGMSAQGSKSSSSGMSRYMPMPASGLESGLTTEFWNNMLGYSKKDQKRYEKALSDAKKIESKIAKAQQNLQKARADGRQGWANIYQNQLTRLQTRLDTANADLEIYKPAYIEEAEGQRPGIDAAHQDILSYLQGQAPVLSQAYGDAGSTYSGQVNDLIQMGMSGEGLSPVTLENINNLARGIDISLGGENVGAFVSGGNADALESILSNRTANMSTVEGLASSLYGNTTGTAERQAEIGMTPLQKALQIAEMPTVNQGMMGDLWSMISPMTELRYITGGPFETFESDSKSFGGGMSVGI